MIGSHGKLTQDRAEVIKSLLIAGEHTHQQIADLAKEMWGISISRELVTKINLGMRWNPHQRSFEMKNNKPKTGNDFRQFTTSPTERKFTEEDITRLSERIQHIVEQNLLNYKK